MELTHENGSGHRRRSALLGALVVVLMSAALLAGPSIASAGSPSAAYLTSPLGQTLSSPNQTFTWNSAPGATEYWLYIGRSLGANNVYDSGAIWAPTTSKTATNLPADGSTLYVRLWTWVGGAWQYNDYVFAAAQPAPRITPAQGSNLYAITSGCPTYQTFSWTAMGGNAWWLYVGTTMGGTQVANSGSLAVTTYTTTNPLPNPGAGNSELIYVRLWTHLSTGWTYTDYVYNDIGGTLNCP